MADPEPEKLISGDKPIADPKDDVLGYSEFAEHLAEAVDKMLPPVGIVLGIHGPWGSGKTSMLNLVEYYLNRLPEERRPLVHKYNPWWFSDQEDIRRRFLLEMEAHFNKSEAITKEVRKRFAGLVDALLKAPDPTNVLGPVLSVSAKLFGTKPTDIVSVKDKLAAALQEQKKRIVVIIDDIDRLTAQEIREVFQLIKSVADLPNVVYLVAFDRSVVTAALNGVQAGTGDSYLEKIIQVPFELPVPDRPALRNLLFSRINTILADTPDNLVDEDHWDSVYWRGLDDFILTPRTVARLGNSLALTYPLVRGEVNAADFIALSTLSLCAPEAHSAIREFPDRFADGADIILKQAEFKQFHERWRARLPEAHRDAAQRLVCAVFPALSTAWPNIAITDGSDSATRRRKLRACCKDILPTYLRLAPPEGAVTNRELTQLLSACSDATALGSILIGLAKQPRPIGGSRLRDVLGGLAAYTSEVDLACIPELIEAYLSVGDQLLLLDREPTGPFEFGIELLFSVMVQTVLYRLPEPARFAAVQHAIDRGASVGTIVMLVAKLGLQHGKYDREEHDPQADVLVTDEHLAVLEKAALEKIRKAAEAEIDGLLGSPLLTNTLYRWRDWAGEGEPRRWVTKIIQSDEGLATLLGKFLVSSKVYSMGTGRAKPAHKFDLSGLEWFVDPAQLQVKAGALLENGKLTGDQRLAIERFLKALDRKAQGKNLSDLAPWEDE